MTIVHVIPFLWSGAGHVLTRLCQAQRLHADVHVVTSGRSRGLSDWVRYRRTLVGAGVHLHRVNTFDRTPAAFWGAVEALTSLLTRTWPDIVHAHAGVPALACGHARARLSGRRPGLVAHMYSWGSDRPGWMDVMDTVGFTGADATVCSARAYRRVLRAHGIPASRLHYVPPAYPVVSACHQM